MVQRFLRIAVLILALGQMGSSCHGTETGNPQHAGGTSGCPALTAAASQQPLDDVIDDLCQRIIQCGVVAPDSCVNELNGPAGDSMTPKFGLTPGTTVSVWRSELISGAVTVNTAEESACLSDLKAIACDEVTANVFPTDFSGVANIIPNSCVTAFSSNEASTLPSPTGCP